MKFEHYLRLPQGETAPPISISPPSVIWNFTNFNAKIYEGAGPILKYTLPSHTTLQSFKTLYHFLDNDLALWGRHTEVQLLNSEGALLETWHFDIQKDPEICLKEEPLGIYHPGNTHTPPFWNYGGYYKPGCTRAEIERILFTVRYVEGEVVPFLIRESALKIYCES